MPSYIVTACCETCSVNHLTGIELNWMEQIPPNKALRRFLTEPFCLLRSL